VTLCAILIIDEAHLLVDLKRTMKLKRGGTVDTFGGAVLAVSTMCMYLSACLWIRTQVSLEQSTRLTSAVAKTEGKIPIYAFCSFPYVTAERFAELAESILGPEFIPASHLLYGRARIVSTLIWNQVVWPRRDAMQVIEQVRNSTHLVSEIKRVMGGAFGETDLLDLWLASITYDENCNTFSPERHGGMLSFTSCFTGDEFAGVYSTGWQLSQEPSR